MLAARHPERVQGAVLIAPAAPFGPSADIDCANFIERKHYGRGLGEVQSHYWRATIAAFAQFFFGEALCEPHSTKQIEDAVGWALETTPEMSDRHHARALCRLRPGTTARSFIARIRCPVLVIHGDEDEIVPYGKGEARRRSRPAAGSSRWQGPAMSRRRAIPASSIC